MSSAVTVLTTRVSLPDSAAVEIETDKVLLRLDYVGNGFIDVHLQDKVRKTFFEFISKDYEASRNKLEQFITKGISERDHEFLTYISSLKTWRSQSKYFEELGRGTLELNTVIRAAKLSAATKFTSDQANDAKTWLVNELPIICQASSGYRSQRIQYAKKDEYEFILHSEHHYDGYYPCCFAVVTELGAKYLPSNKYVAYAIYRYLKDGRRDLLEGWLKSVDKKNFSCIIHTLNEPDIIYDKEKCEYLKTVITLSSI
jgi:hypothetical protein